jgi:hypothetical protein
MSAKEVWYQFNWNSLSDLEWDIKILTTEKEWDELLSIPQWDIQQVKIKIVEILLNNR